MPTSIYDFSASGLLGGSINLNDYRGQVMLLVNTASQCGFTKQYAGLEALHRRYAEQGLVVIGFPCNQFGQQEPGDASSIGAFCQKNFGVSFLMADKIDVNGPHSHPLWNYLKQAQPGVLGSHRIKWNFTKFLVDRRGQVVRRFGSITAPSALARHIEALL
ncbi:glutathione peroxidase [Paludibacterium denitrificans]|uniref:Glutathione peroxidase n=1 Tax=Paludibacterium denitrificans TaxID=2675226 RepID=A0A844GE54_9NEIS|nr:glutathione peroxidase [Paludibacterium denitrificans]MTD33551.1 redoxin domain-containing protein [Paludibacterium denitrificans]